MHLELRERERKRALPGLHRKARPVTYWLQLQPNEILIHLLEINESQSLLLLDLQFILALFKRHAFSKFHCVDEKRSSGGENQTKICSMQK